MTAVVLAAGLVVGGTSSAWATDEAAATPTAAVTTADPGPTPAEAAQPTEDAAATPTDTPTTSSPASGPSGSEPAGSSAAPQPDAEPETTAPTTEPAPTSPDPTPAPGTTPAPSPAEGTGPATGLPSTGGTTATASRGCIGETTVVVTVPGLEVGTPVTVRIDALAPVAAKVVPGRPGGPGGKIAVETFGLLDDAVTVSITVQVEDLLFLTSATIADVCTATGSITVSRDCLTPGLVSATVDVAGLQDRLYGVAVIGVTDAGQQVLLASADVEPVDGRVTGTYPLVSVDGAVPLEAITGISLVVDGETFASVTGDVVDLVSCVPAPPVPVVPDPVAPVPASPAPAVPTTTAPVTHPVARPAAPSTTRAVPVAAPATLARTGDDVGSLALLGLVVLGLGVGTTVAARRPVR